MSNPRFLKNFVSFGACLLICLAWVGVINSFSNGENYRIYDDAEIRYSPSPELRIGDFVLRGRDDSFVFVEGIPKKLRVGLLFKRAANLRVTAQANYQQSACQSARTPLASLRLKSGSLDQSIALANGIPTEFNIEVFSNRQVSVELSNKAQRGCGRVRVTFFEAENHAPLLLLYLALWLSLVAICLAKNVAPFSVFLAAWFHGLHLAAESTFASLSLPGFGFSVGTALCVFVVLQSVANLRSSSKLFYFLCALAFLLLSTLNIAALLHQFNFDIPLSIESIHAVFQSYSQQAFEFLLEQTGASFPLSVLIAVAVFALVTTGLIRSNSRNPFAPTFLIFIFLIGGIFATVNLSSSNYIQRFQYAKAKYLHEIEKYERVLQERSVQGFDVQLKNGFEDNQTILVLGESVNKYHMSAYGYARRTTPEVDKRIRTEELIKFSNVYSNHTHSNPTVSMIMTEANQYGDKDWAEAASTIEITKAAGLPTLWLSNHRMLGGWSNYITAIAKGADQSQTINMGVGYGNASPKYDEDLIPLFEKNYRGEGLAVLHFYNSHFSYCKRYPEQAEIHVGEFNRINFGQFATTRARSAGMFNCYDNTISYTDSLLGDLYDRFSEDETPTLIVYIADHSENLVEGTGHNSAVFSFPMTNIPLFVWANDSWKAQHPDLWGSLRNNKDKVITNDLTHHAMAGLMGLEYSALDKRYDFTDLNYQSLEAPKTMHGKIALDRQDNWHYWQKANAAWLLESERAFSARGVESLSDIYMAVELGATAVQLDVEVSPEGRVTLASSTWGEAVELGELAERIRKPFSPLQLILNDRSGSKSIQGADALVSQAIREQFEQKGIQVKYKRELEVEEISAPLWSVDFQEQAIPSSPTFVSVVIKTDYSVDYVQPD